MTGGTCTLASLVITAIISSMLLRTELCQLRILSSRRFFFVLLICSFLDSQVFLVSLRCAGRQISMTSSISSGHLPVPRTGAAFTQEPLLSPPRRSGLPWGAPVLA